MNTFAHAVKRLYDSPTNVKYNLDRIVELCERLDNPQNKYKIFHVAGTNGKGSTCSFLDALLAEQGFKRGWHCSPHLQTPRERIVIDGQMVTEAQFVALESEVFEQSKKMQDAPSFFERMAAMAFLAFARFEVEVAIVEVGLGGRLDATNIVKPSVCGITSISRDHERLLGDTLEKIASEKAGIIKPGVPVVSDVQENCVEQVIRKTAQKNNSALVSTQDLLLKIKKTALAGAHQKHNAAIAVKMVEAFVGKRINFKQALLNAKWPGRYETVSENPLILLDGAHNPAAAQALAKTISEDERIADKKRIFVLGFSRGHDPKEFVEALLNTSVTLGKRSSDPGPRAQYVNGRASIPEKKVFSGSRVRHGMSNGTLIESEIQLSSGQNERLLSVQEIEYALEGICLSKPFQGFKPDSDICYIVTGSLYLLGEISQALLQHSHIHSELH